MPEFNSKISIYTPAAYYRFNSGALTTDTSAGGHTLTAIGVPVDGTPKFGGAVGLGTSQAFSAVDGADFQPSGNFSFSVWIKSVNVNPGGERRILQSFSKNTAYAGFVLTVVAGTNGVRFYIGKNTGTTETTDWARVSSTANVNDGLWHHIVGTYDGAKIHIYVDSVEQGTGTVWTGNAVFAATNYVRVGVGSDTGTATGGLFGAMDDVAFFNGTALSLAQVQTLYANELNTQSAILALATAYWRFEDGAMLTDTTANAHTLTAIGTPTQLTTKFGGSIFLGNSSAYSAVDHADFQPTVNFTIGGWFKSAKTAVNQFIFTSYSVNTNIAGINLSITSGNAISLRSANNTGTVLNTNYKDKIGTTTVTDNNWHFAVGTWDGSLLHVYLDGREEGSGASWANAPAYAATNYVRVGTESRTGANEFFFFGQLDDIFLLNGTALTDPQINNLYSTGSFAPFF